MPYTLEKARILVVDDMRPMVNLTTTVLKIFGFKEVYTAEDGEEGFEMVCRHDPDLIITDWLMAPMDGLEFTEKIRRSPMTPNPYVPVLMMTGFSSRFRVEKARDMGITEFLVKPFSARDLYARVAQIVEKPRQFVDAGNFFGPDRRRRKNDEYGGPIRRGDDLAKAREAMTNNDGEMTNILKKLREEAKSVSE
ncbi:MAG: response regulator [Alphaproteobacteria bacterium]|nr:response regulator [Alphaproteobacteria bacterium]